MLQSALRLLRRATGTQQVMERTERLEALTRELAVGLSKLGVPTNAGLEILPGTPYSRYALPIEYRKAPARETSAGITPLGRRRAAASVTWTSDASGRYQTASP